MKPTSVLWIAVIASIVASPLVANECLPGLRLDALFTAQRVNDKVLSTLRTSGKIAVGRHLRGFGWRKWDRNSSAWVARANGLSVAAKIYLQKTTATVDSGDFIGDLMRPCAGYPNVSDAQMKAAADLLDGAASAIERATRTKIPEEDKRIAKAIVGEILTGAGVVKGALIASQPARTAPSRVDESRGPAVPIEHGGDRRQGEPGCCFDYEAPRPDPTTPGREGPVNALVVPPDSSRAWSIYRPIEKRSNEVLEQDVKRAESVARNLPKG
jgi:hypothetical protein